MRYLESISFITAKPGWFKNLFLCALCLLIPVIGPIVVVGYTFEVFDSLRRDPEKLRYPDFDFNQFLTYLIRGCWPALVQIIVSFALIVPMAILVGVSVAITVAMHRAGAIAAVVWIVFAIFVLFISFAATLFVWPMMTYAGVSQGLDFPGMFSFASDFVRKMLVELIITLIFGFFAAWLLGIVGLICCCVGVYLSSAASQLMFHHLSVQLYEIYLGRGGTPIPAPRSRS